MITSIQVQVKILSYHKEHFLWKTELISLNLERKIY